MCTSFELALTYITCIDASVAVFPFLSVVVACSGACVCDARCFMMIRTGMMIRHAEERQECFYGELRNVALRQAK